MGFAVLRLVIKTIDDAGAAAGANGLNVTLDAQLVSDIKSIASARLYEMADPRFPETTPGVVNETQHRRSNQKIAPVKTRTTAPEIHAQGEAAHPHQEQQQPDRSR